MGQRSFPGLGVTSTSICYPSCSTCLWSEEVALQEVHGPQHVGDLTALIKLVMLIEQISSVDVCVDTGAKMHALIFHHVGTQLLSTPVLDFLAKVVEVLNCGEVKTLFGL